MWTTLGLFTPQQRKNLGKIEAQRMTVGRILPEKNCGVGVSTVWVGDEGKYETALLHVTGATPVERYTTLGAAQKGHARWVVASRTVRHVRALGVKNGRGPREVDIVPCDFPPAKGSHERG